MVKVVGTDPGAIKRITCKNCASILEYTPSEMFRYSGTDYGGGPDGREWINCPKCNTDVTIRSW